MNNSGPRYKRSQLEKRLNTDVLWCVVLLIIMCLTSAVGGYRHWLTARSSHSKTQLWTATIISECIPGTHPCPASTSCVQSDELLRCLGLFQVTASGWRTWRTPSLGLIWTRLPPWLDSMSSGLWSLCSRYNVKRFFLHFYSHLLEAALKDLLDLFYFRILWKQINASSVEFRFVYLLQYGRFQRLRRNINSTNQSNC